MIEPSKATQRAEGEQSQKTRPRKAAERPRSQAEPSGVNRPAGGERSQKTQPQASAARLLGEGTLEQLLTFVRWQFAQPLPGRA
jgi:hypothetical protein